MASLIKRGDSGQQVFTKIYFLKVFVGIAPIVAGLGLGAYLLSPAVPFPLVGHLVVGGGLVVGALGLAALLAVPDILKNRDHLTVTGDAITFETWGDGSRVTLSRQEGDLLLVLPGFTCPGRHFSRRITQLGTGHTIQVGWFFPKRAIWRACERSGWRFGYRPDLAERHLRRWRDWGWRASAYQLIRLHGPFAMPEVPGSPLSLGAAILAEYGDEITKAVHTGLRPSPPGIQLRRHAVRVYRQAAAEQRVYATLAASADERAARTTQADWLAEEAVQSAP